MKHSQRLGCKFAAKMSPSSAVPTKAADKRSRVHHFGGGGLVGETLLARTDTSEIAVRAGLVTLVALVTVIRCRGRFPAEPSHTVDASEDSVAVST